MYYNSHKSQKPWSHDTLQYRTARQFWRNLSCTTAGTKFRFSRRRSYRIEKHRHGIHLRIVAIKLLFSVEYFTRKLGSMYSLFSSMQIRYILPCALCDSQWGVLINKLMEFKFQLPLQIESLINNLITQARKLVGTYSFILKNVIKLCKLYTIYGCINRNALNVI